MKKIAADRNYRIFKGAAPASMDPGQRAFTLNPPAQVGAKPDAPKMSPEQRQKWKQVQGKITWHENKIKALEAQIGQHKQKIKTYEDELWPQHKE
jgi:hypothetical protein